MRIAIDARKLRDYGIGTYVRNLLRHLARIDQATEYVLLCREPDCQIVSELGENFRAVTEGSPGYSIREQVTVPLDLRREPGRAGAEGEQRERRGEGEEGLAYSHDAKPFERNALSAV